MNSKDYVLIKREEIDQIIGISAKDIVKVPTLSHFPVELLGEIYKFRTKYQYALPDKRKSTAYVALIRLGLEMVK